MIRVCMACGKRTEVEPLGVKDETMGVCRGPCVEAYRKWQGISVTVNKLTLHEFYLLELSNPNAHVADDEPVDAHEEDASRASWHPSFSAP